MNQAKQIFSSVLSFATTLLAALLLSSTLAVANAETSSGTKPLSKNGIAIVLGGALKYDNDVVWQRIVDLAGGKGAKFAVLATASGEPEKSAAQIIEVLTKHGAVAEHIPVAPKLMPLFKGGDARKAAHDGELVAKIKSSQGVFFSGGAQERITDTLFEADGKQTPVLAAIWHVFNQGGVVAGTSAGAAIMSTTMFRDAPDVLNVLKFGARDGKEIDRGLGFAGAELFVDQHFLKRGRLGRMLPVMVQKNYRLGLGIDENSGAIVRGDNIEIIGSKGALVADLGDVAIDKALSVFNLKNAKITYLERGDRFNLKTKNVTPSAQKMAGKKLDANAEKYSPYFSTDMFYPDILGDNIIVNAISNLIDNKQESVVGLAFSGMPSDGDKEPDLGFEFRFRKGKDSYGYFTSAMGGENYTVVNIYLDVLPVNMSRPLYRQFTNKSGTITNNTASTLRDSK
jgi:cyanophycinase